MIKAIPYLFRQHCHAPSLLKRKHEGSRTMERTIVSRREFLGVFAATASLPILPMLIGTGTASAAPPLFGSPNVEPGLAQRSDLILFEDFESADWARTYSWTTGQTN